MIPSSFPSRQLVRCLDAFVCNNNPCFVVEKLSISLQELLNRSQDLSLELIQKFAKQLLVALSFLADVGVIHADLKPENILLCHSTDSKVKVIDFGLSWRLDKGTTKTPSNFGTRHYRSPEGMLRLGSGTQNDIWSLGCTLAELWTGNVLFNGLDRIDQLRKVIELLGMVPDSMLMRTDTNIKERFFQTTGRTGQHHKEKPKSAKQIRISEPPCFPSVNPIAALTKIIKDLFFQTTGRKEETGQQQAAKQIRISGLPCNSTVDPIAVLTHRIPYQKNPMDPRNSQEAYELFIDLLSKMLTYEPQERITPQEGLRHPFILWDGN